MTSPFGPGSRPRDFLRATPARVSDMYQRFSYLRCLALTGILGASPHVLPASQDAATAPTPAPTHQRGTQLKAEALKSSAVSAPACDIALVPPKSAKTISNLIVLTLDIGPDGLVTRTRVVRSTGSKETDHQVSECISHWKFHASSHGMQVTSTVVIDM